LRERLTRAGSVLFVVVLRYLIGGRTLDTYFMTLIQVLESREKALTVQEVAELLGVSDKHIYKMTADGTLPAFYVGRSVRLDPQDIADWLRKKKPIPTKRGAEGRAPKHRALNRSQNGDTKAVYQVLRSKVHNLEAATAIERESR
jgi:excisionase family DNA binding protein